MAEKDPKEDPASTKRWIACQTEEDYFGNRLKASRKERKRLSAKDRSKFKKSDRDKYESGRQSEIQDRSAEGNLMRGRVLSITSQGFIVEHEGRQYTCFLRGLLKREKTLAKNIVAVGDFVYFEEKPDNEGLIASVEPRRSVLSRADNLSRKKEQLIAANIDQVVITASVVSPPLKPALIDRYIIAARIGKMEPLIVINKIDLLEEGGAAFDPLFIEEQKALLEECRKAYEGAGVKLIVLSADTGQGLDLLQAGMSGLASVFSGQSGTGKSSLINKITGLDLPTGETVRRTKKGAHTTTQAQLVPLPFGGWCIDTPGIKSFGVWDLEPKDLEGYFTEIRESGMDCKFPDCSHSHETGCRVIAAVAHGEIPEIRYQSYLSLLETVRESHKRR